MSTSNIKLVKTLKRFNAKIEDGSYYEALLTLQTIVNRYIPSKNYTDAIELLYHASLTLLDHKQISSAYDSTIRIIEIFKLQDLDYTEYKNSQLPKLLQLLNKFPNNDPTLKALSKEAISYSISKSPYKLGDPLLNYLFAEKFLLSGNSDNYQNVENLLVLSGANNASALELYVQLLTQIYDADKTAISATTLIGRLVINYLYVGNIKFAIQGLDKLIKNFKLTNYKEESNLFIFEDNDFKLLNFFQLLIKSVRNSNSEMIPAYKALLNRYKSDLEQLDLLAQVDYIGQIYFNVTVLQKQNNMMLNLLSGFLGGSGGGN